MTLNCRKLFFNIIAIAFVIQILQFTIESDAFTLQRPAYFFQKKPKFISNENFQQKPNKFNFFDNRFKSKFMFKRMTPCYYSPIQCLVK
ncbi:Hypothetical protein SRAE_X000218300 [Strongyloides ratti]|uniref:Uncharacterized protein n=1 Tax=Strongyloides ratti TaxID=34506 RepID=A0A090KSF2_STRRB|nr:Hypothetical protein SRAE_X000218300 [Strongyloides ratti]CEF60445.1 Hypothetical protein SRAE_X000218300 [Strongyloides ratti]